MAPLATTLNTVQELTLHPGFDFKNPNKVYALILGFTPGCQRSQRSSDAMTASRSSGATSSSVTGTRQMPSAGRNRRSAAPSPARTTVAAGGSRRSKGNGKTASASANSG